MLPWQQHICQLSYQKSEVCVVNLCVVVFDDRRIKGFREKREWNTGTKTVFGHLKPSLKLHATWYSNFIRCGNWECFCFSGNLNTFASQFQQSPIRALHKFLGKKVTTPQVRKCPYTYVSVPFWLTKNSHGGCTNSCLKCLSV